MADDDFTKALPPQYYTEKPRTPNLSKELLDYIDLQSLIVMKKQVLQLIQTVQRNPRPSYNIDGQEVKWTEYLNALYDKLNRLNDLISIEEGPIEEETIAWN